MANPSMRDSAGINDRGGKNVNPINKAVNTFTSYVGNVASSYSKWDNLKNAPAHSPEAGQFWGAVLQNRRYDSNGNIIGAPKRAVGPKTPIKK